MLLEKKESILPLTLDFFNELHFYLSHGYLSKEELLKDSFRCAEYQGFNLGIRNVTKAGLIELIHRIQRDNVETGFVIATLKIEDLLDSITRRNITDYNEILEKARQIADIRLDTVRGLSSEQIDKLAESYLKKIETKKDKWFSAPKIDFAKQQAEIAIKQFNLEIKTCKTPTEIIQTCVKLVHELEILHLFPDVNCRTNCLMLKALLWLQGIKPPVFYEPNCIDLFSIDEIVREVKDGIYTADLIQNNQEEFLQKHEKLCIKDKERFSNKLTNPSEYLDNISRSLVDGIARRNQQYRAKISELEKLLENKLNEKEKSTWSNLKKFISKKSKSEYKILDQLQAIFDEFKSTHDAINFFRQVENINPLIRPNSFGQALNEKIQELKDLSGLGTALTLYKELKPKADQPRPKPENQLSYTLK